MLISHDLLPLQRHGTTISSILCKPVLKVLLFLLINITFLSSEAFSQKTTGSTDYDEEPVELWHRNIGSVTLNAVIAGTSVYIQPGDLFNLAKIRCDISEDKKIISGYFIEETRLYKIDYGKRVITYKDDNFPIAKDQIIETSTGTYLRCDAFEKVFNVKCTFDFSNLSIEVQAGEPLPAESEAAAAKNRSHMQHLDENFIPDRRLGLQRSLFSVGTLDYQGGGSLVQGSKGTSNYNVLFGGQILGGDFDGTMTLNQGDKVNWKNVPWQYRTAIENSSLISQIIIGKRATFSTLSLPDSMIGMQVTNAQTGYKTSFSNYTISDRTEPNWTVELYINDVLINYVKADQTGYYKFVIPLSYGSTNVVLKFHGPYGEVRVQTVQLRIPYTFLPPGHLEYTATGGTSLDHPNINNALGKFDTKIGISTFMTGGAGLLYQHDENGKAFYSPYGTSSLRVTSGILLGGEYYYGSGYRTSMNVSGPVGFSMDLEYDHPLGGDSVSFAGQSITDQRKIQLNTPLPYINGSLRLSAVDVPVNVDTGMVSLTAQTLISFFGASLDLSANYGLLRDRFKFHQNGSLATGSAGLTFTLLNGFMVHSSLNVNYTALSVTDMQIMMSKALGSFATFSVTGGYSFVTHDKQLQCDIRMNLPFAQIGASGSGGTGQPYQGTGTIQGSLGFDPNTTSLVPSNRPEVRRGGIVLEPFLDLNNDGKREPNEPLVKHFGFEQAPGKVVEESDGMLRVMDMEPYRKYILKTSCNDIENIAWVPKFSSFEITPPANGYTLVEVPITVAGQIEGYVYLKGVGKDEPQGGARIKIRHRDIDDSSEVVVKEDLLSYSNGEFYYIGIPPGKYRAYIDPKQLSLLHYSSDPPYRDFELSNKEEGDSVEGLNFTLKGGALAPVPAPLDPNNISTRGLK
jgi:hypothetical protein